VRAPRSTFCRILAHCLENVDLGVGSGLVTLTVVGPVTGSGDWWAPSKRDRATTYLMIGRTYGERPIIAAVIYDEVRERTQILQCE
jgi:hypothetical protein